MPATVIVGLGTLGLAIGRRIVAVTAEDVIGVETDAPRRAEWEKLSGKPAHARFDAIGPRRVRRVLIVVRSEEQVDTIFGEIVAHPASEPVHVYVLSTVSRAFAQRLARGTPPAVRLVEFPVTGGGAAALNGTLVAMAAGLRDGAERAFMIGSIASRIIDFGDYGDPAFAKLLNNATIGYQAATLNKVLHLGREHGIDPNALLEVIANGAASSYISKAILRYNDALLGKDLQLLRASVEPLPTIDIDGISEQFAAVRKLLARDS
jgi:3-hydroxyisobutyrate dehydrogenase